jgi:energy-coupling factor transporter ATP-binding protein EcfA2
VGFGPGKPRLYLNAYVRGLEAVRGSAGSWMTTSVHQLGGRDRRMTRQEDAAQSVAQGEIGRKTIDGEAPAVRHLDDKCTTMPTQRDPSNTLRGCQRILILGRTGSGKTTLARELAAAIGVPHVELDALYFGPDFSTAPLPVLRDRTIAAIAGDRWVTDGNKRAVRDLVWPRADTVIWLDYPLVVSLWRLGKRALWRTSVLKAQAAEKGGKAGLPRQFLSAAKGVLAALRSHKGQRREYPKAFAEQENQHLAVVRLRSQRATRRWLAHVTRGSATCLRFAEVHRLWPSPWRSSRVRWTLAGPDDHEVA